MLENSLFLINQITWSRRSNLHLEVDQTEIYLKRQEVITKWPISNSKNRSVFFQQLLINSQWKNQDFLKRRNKLGLNMVDWIVNLKKQKETTVIKCLKRDMTNFLKMLKTWKLRIKHFKTSFWSWRQKVVPQELKTAEFKKSFKKRTCFKTSLMTYSNFHSSNEKQVNLLTKKTKLFDSRLKRRKLSINQLVIRLKVLRLRMVSWKMNSKF